MTELAASLAESDGSTWAYNSAGLLEVFMSVISLSQSRRGMHDALLSVV